MRILLKNKKCYYSSYTINKACIKYSENILYITVLRIT